jgi:3-dehydroquinate synthase
MKGYKEQYADEPYEERQKILFVVDSLGMLLTPTDKDQFEKGERKKLNFGHTFGHAIESYYLEKGTPISHGEAVFMGMILETEISNLSEPDKNEIKNYVLSNFALPYTPKKSSLHKFLRNDKKNQNGKINFTLLNGIGNCSFDNLFSLNEL